MPLQVLGLMISGGGKSSGGGCHSSSGPVAFRDAMSYFHWMRELALEFCPL